MEEQDYIYAAGVVDCDGSLGGYLSGKHEVLQLIVVVGVTDQRLPIWLAEKFGGKVRVQHRPDSKPKWRTMYRWEINGHKAAQFVERIRPYLTIKREQADIFLQLDGTTTRNGVRLTEGTKELRRTLVADLSALKHRTTWPQ